jgi:hypothetical protein
MLSEYLMSKYRTGGVLTLLDTLSAKKQASKKLWSSWGKSGPTAQFSLRTRLLWVYSICYGNEGASSSVSDVDRYVITRKLLDYNALNDILHLLWEPGCVIVS